MIFKNIRLSYLDDLENDPEVMEAIAEPENRFVDGLYDPRNRYEWNPDISSKIPGFKLFNEGERVGPIDREIMKWGRVGELSLDSFEVRCSDAKTANTSLVPEGYMAVWDTKTNSMWFLSSYIMDQCVLPEFKDRFFDALGKTLDSMDLTTFSEAVFNV